MNRSILIVICDFLLVSMLAFSSIDINKLSEDGRTQTGQMNLATNPPAAGNDLAAVMRQALDQERERRDQLVGELNRTKVQAVERERQAQNLQQQLQQELQSREQTAQQLQQNQASLERQYSVAQSNLQALNQKWQSSLNESLLTKEQLAAMKAESAKQSEQAALLQNQLASLSVSNQAVLKEKQMLAGQLQVAEVERQHAKEQVLHMVEEVKVEREEKAKLAEGVKALASNSGQLAQEIRENRAIAPNTIFSTFVSNRVTASFCATRPGLFGAATSTRRETDTILVSDGTNTYSLFHVHETPLTLWDPGTDWSGLTGWLTRDAAAVPISSLAFSFRDPRVGWILVESNAVRTLGCMVYHTSSDPFKFQDAVLIGSQGGYYGECRFQIDMSEPDYVKLDNNFLKGLFGKFNPSRGDLVFSKANELLGVMVNNTYCLVIHRFDASATLQFGGDVEGQHTGQLLSALSQQVFHMPLKLQ